MNFDLYFSMLLRQEAHQQKKINVAEGSDDS